MTSVRKVDSKQQQQQAPREESPDTRTVRKGEKLDDIARDLGVTTAELIDANPQLRGKNKINSGMELKVPQKRAQAPALDETGAPEDTRAPAPGRRGAVADVDTHKLNGLVPSAKASGPTPPNMEALLGTNSVDAPEGVPATSPYYQGRVKADGRTMVGEDGKPFTWRGVSEFMLPQMLNDKTKTPEEREAAVAKRLDERVAQGYSVVRTFGNVAWDNAKLSPFEDWEGYKQNTEKLFSMAKDRGLYVEFTALTDVDKTMPKEKVGEYMDWVADTTKKYPNTFVEVANESFKNGLSDQEVKDLGRRFKARAPDVMLAGSSPNADGVDPNAPDGDGTKFGKAPFDYITLHPERSDGDGGFRWVRHMREGEAVSAETGKPVVQDEPIGSQATNEPGRRDNDPVHFRDGAIVTAITGQGFTFHTQRAVTPDPNAHVPEPGVDQTNVSDLVPQGMKGYHFVNGHWPDSPFDASGQFDGNVLRVFTKMKDDKSGFVTYPLDVQKETTLKLKDATHLTIMDLNTREKLEDRDFAAGEVLKLQPGQDVLIYGGNIERPDIRKPISTTPQTPPPPATPDDPIPAQREARNVKGQKHLTPMAQDMTARLYRGLLGREPDSDGQQGWTRLVEKGELSRAVNGLVSSSEFQARKDRVGVGALSTSLYRALLDRDPDEGGLAGTKNAIAQGALAQRVIDMLTSPEFRSKHPG